MTGPTRFALGGFIAVAVMTVVIVAVAEGGS